MGSLADELRKKVLIANTPPTQSAEQGQGGEPSISASTTYVVDLKQSPEWALMWAAAGIELLGQKILVRELEGAANEGTGRARSSFDTVIEGAISRHPRAEAEAWRKRLPNLGGRKGVPTFLRDAEEVLTVLKNGAVETYMAEQRELSAEAKKLMVPTLEEGEDRYAYQQRLEAWSGDKVEAVLKVMGFDAYRLSCEAVERRAQVQRMKSTALWTEACKAFDQSGDFVALSAAEQVVVGRGYTSASAKYHAAAHVKWAWPCVSAGHLTPADPSVPPPTKWVIEQHDQDFVLRCSQEACCQYAVPPRDFRPVFRTRLLEISNLKPSADMVLVRGKLAIDHQGRTIPLSKWLGQATDRGGYHRTEVTEEQGEKLCSVQPSSNGWVTIQTVKDWSGKEKLQATLYGPDAFKALQVARSVKAGCGGVDVRPWLENFCRDPNRGFGMFSFRVVAGAAHRSGMFISVDDRLRDRIELVKKLPDPADAPFAEDVYYVPMRIVKRERGGHAVWTESGSRAIAYQKETQGTQCSRRYIGSTVSHRESGSALAWTLSASTRAQDRQLVVAVIGQGQELHLSTGMALGFDGQKLVEIPGGALQPGEGPTD